MEQIQARKSTTRTEAPEVTEAEPTTTRTDEVDEIIAEVDGLLAEIDAIVDNDVASIGDDLLMASVADNPVQKVKRVANQSSGQSSGWTLGGRVD